MRILVFGLPGSGKTTLADALAEMLGKCATRFNADQIRKLYDDWDFSDAGRLRQAERMYTLSVWAERKLHVPYVITDFVAPTPETRAIFKADFAIWMNTIDAGRFENTNKVWLDPVPGQFDAVVTKFNAEEEVKWLCQKIFEKNPPPADC
jgi:adenylylsulfate kinase